MTIPQGAKDNDYDYPVLWSLHRKGGCIWKTAPFRAPSIRKITPKRLQILKNSFWELYESTISELENTSTISLKATLVQKV